MMSGSRKRTVSSMIFCELSRQVLKKSSTTVVGVFGPVPRQTEGRREVAVDSTSSRTTILCQRFGSFGGTSIRARGAAA